VEEEEHAAEVWRAQQIHRAERAAKVQIVELENLTITFEFQSEERDRNGIYYPPGDYPGRGWPPKSYLPASRGWR
jgi:hypothetical protein